MNNVDAPRRPWLAALFSAVLPGFGQLYVGNANRALGLFLAFTLLQIPSLIIILLLPVSFTTPVVVLTTVASIGVWIFGIVDAWRQARRTNPFVRAAWQTRTVYLSVFLLTGFVLLPSVIGYVRANLVQAFHISSGSMQPTLLRGDLVFANMRYNCIRCKSVRRGDIALFIYPNNRKFHYIKRIIGLPHDNVEIDNGQLKVNGDVVHDGFDIDNSVSMPSRTVAAGHVFVLGDNRNASNDSRKFGEVPLADVVGWPRQIWFSSGEDGVRWDRIGRAVQIGS